ncbi:MAG TPA: hypothetical protein VGO92_14000, partial [Acidimicrobiales bacterium]|nr:hypothetical protein [Acidimicrobiales bacterium]
RARMEDPDGFHRALIHQLFVSFEYAHNFAVTTVEPGRTPWFYEASAGWAEWELFRKGSTSLHQQYFASMFNSAPQLALEQPEGDLAPLADEQHAVRAYIWPFFMQQEAGGSPQPIYDAWKATDGVTSWPAFHAAIDAQRPFATSFQDFAVRNLNLDLGAATSPGYHDLDPNFAPGSTPGLTYDLFLERPQAADARALGGPGGPGLRPLSAEYDHVVVDPASGIRTLSLDFGGLSPASGAGVTVLTQAHDGTWARRDVAPGSRLDLCFDNAGDEIDQLYVIVGNHQRMTDFDTPATSSLSGSYTVAAAAAC